MADFDGVYKGGGGGVGGKQIGMNIYSKNK